MVGVGVMASVAAAKTYRVNVAAAPVDRAAQVVDFKFPAEAKGFGFLKGASGPLVPVQVDGNGVARAGIPVQ